MPDLPFSLIAEVNPSVRIPNGLSDKDAVSFIPMGDVSESGHWMLKQVRQLKSVDAGLTAFEEGDVLVAKITPCLENGKGAHVVGLENGIGFGSTEFHVLRAKRGNNARFVFHLTQWRKFRHAAESQMVGSAGQQRVPRSFFDEFLVPDFDVGQQTAVAEILDTLDAAIQETEAIIAKLKAIKQGLLHDLLTRGIDANGELRPSQAEAPHLYKSSPLGWIPNGWNVHPLENLAEVTRGKFTHRPRNDPRFYGGRHPFVQTGDIAATQGEYLSSYSQTLSDRGVSVSQEFPAGAIAITIAANIADTAILAIPMYFPDSVVGAVVNSNHNIRFVELSIRKAKRGLDARAPQSAQKNINLQDLRPLLLAVPERAEQNRIAGRYEALQLQLQSEQEALAKYRYEKSGLMDDLLTGRVRVTPLLEGAPA
ncbi:restriction endonuclease subunit S [Dyella sp. M7H15-1]|uniref:restriction endonuclease subunit S n=1 Tax=Dyella sp. M7H15-1 TaxID=2501295 RepID=UPI001004F45E|nr:restriction endonuclease subunit S [Dyella sp. M7H15-1]QAU24806.1 restriction endonuclease subunit S [Dyella sp. M7H15-1]